MHKITSTLVEIFKMISCLYHNRNPSVFAVNSFQKSVAKTKSVNTEVLVVWEKGGLRSAALAEVDIKSNKSWKIWSYSEKSYQPNIILVCPFIQKVKTVYVYILTIIGMKYEYNINRGR